MSNAVKHRYVNVEERDDALYMYDSNDKKYKYLCRYLDVNQVTKDILTGDVSVEMGYSYKGDYMTTVVDRGIFTKGKLLNTLPSKGIDITENNVGKVLNYLLAQEEDAPHINSHKKLGWSEIRSGDGYKMTVKERIKQLSNNSRKQMKKSVFDHQNRHVPILSIVLYGTMVPKKMSRAN